MFLVGVKIASRTDHPWSSRYPMHALSPDARSQSDTLAVTPLNSISLARDELYACLLGVAHLQLSLKYPRWLSFLSRLCSSEGHSPTSSLNASKESLQRSQTVIPLAPYLSYPVADGISHREIIPLQTRKRRPLL